jgi:quercetin dioxygenase-like cupin family protein
MSSNGPFHDTAETARFSDQKLQKVNLFESSRMFCDVYCLQPGQAQKPHAHKGSDKIYHVLTGTVSVCIGDEVRTLSAGQLAVAAASVDHGVENESDEPATVLVFMAPHPAPPPIPSEVS